MGYKIDLRGEKYGRLTVLEYVETMNRNPRWLCKCDCGNTTITTTCKLRSGHTKSCGCLSKETSSLIGKRYVANMQKANYKHGGVNDRLYRVWSSMLSRCNNQNDDAYKWYGARGITVHEEWHDYSVFKEWAEGSGYDPNAKNRECTLDRIDTNGDYCKTNCRWVDAKTQSNNRRSNRLYTYNGETKNIKQWSEQYGIEYATLRNRLVVHNWDIERALTEKVNERGRHCAVGSRCCAGNEQSNATRTTWKT